MKILPIPFDVDPSCMVHIHHDDKATKECSLPPDKAAVIEEIKQKAFGPEAWKNFFGVRTCKYELDDRILKFLLKRDVFAPDQFNYMTHLPPILMPKILKEDIPQTIPSVHRHRFTKYIGRMQYNFEVLDKLVQTPLKGHPSRIDFPSAILTDIEKQQSRFPCWLVVRKELVARDLSTIEQIKYMKKKNEETNAGYEELPSAFDLSTVALVHRVVTGERYLADQGSEMRTFSSLSRCKETVEVKSENQPVVVGSHTDSDSQKSRGGLLVAYIPSESKAPSVGVAAVKKLPATKRQKK